MSDGEKSGVDPARERTAECLLTVRLEQLRGQPLGKRRTARR
ncbi:hypothetical protein [Streptomyces sp. NPDC051662]